MINRETRKCENILVCLISPHFISSFPSNPFPSIVLVLTICWLKKIEYVSISKKSLSPAKFAAPFLSNSYLVYQQCVSLRYVKFCDRFGGCLNSEFFRNPPIERKIVFSCQSKFRDHEMTKVLMSKGIF